MKRKQKKLYKYLCIQLQERENNLNAVGYSTEQIMNDRIAKRLRMRIERVLIK